MIYVVITHDPQRTAHFLSVASELFRGTYLECEAYEAEHLGYIWQASLWDTCK
jgi:hypothetical protein